jgi:ABC-type transport system involved in multi-copper enzyme maturation permease subunit
MLLFAGLIIEPGHEPLELSDLPAATASWLRDAGGLAALGLAIWALAYALRWSAGHPQGIFRHIFGLADAAALGAAGQARRRRSGPLRTLAFLVLAGSSALLYVLFVFLLLAQGRPSRPAGLLKPGELPPTLYTPTQYLFLTLAGALALAAVVLPIASDLVTRIRWRRIWALARLSLKEAWSKGIVWVALIIPIIILYSDYYLTPSHPKDQLSHRVGVVYFALSLLFVVSALLLGSFNIPNDVRNQTIHTIVTKPVERYEIVLGRFIGYALLLLAMLAVLATLSLGYTVRNLHPEAEQESLRARVPLFANEQKFANAAGESVGREWDYRKYIGGIDPRRGGEPPYAVWYFNHIPGSLAQRQEPVPVEYSFDIFRTVKNRDEKQQGVQCSFTFGPGNKSPRELMQRVAEWEKEVRPKLAKAKSREERQEIEDKAAYKFGVYAVKAVPVADYVTQALPGEVPAGLFRNLHEEQGKAKGGEAPALQVLVNLERTSGPQMLGVARRDLYILVGERPYWLNFLKGSLGLWFTACLVLGITVACSTYLSGVISLLAAAFLCGAGLFLDYIRAVASGTASGGGPLEAFYRMTNRKTASMQVEGSSAFSVLQGLDDVYRSYLRWFLNLIPDVRRYDLTRYVASGFDVSWGQVLLADSVIPLLGYLVPCGILAYYLMNSREIANPT